MVKFCLVDVSNLVHRAKHAIGTGGWTSKPYDPLGDEEDTKDMRMGMILHIVFNSLRKSYEKFGAEHCVACFDTRSWRRDVMPEYKAHRRERVRTPEEEEELAMINKTIDELKEFLRDHTNVTVLECQGVEADDFIGRWVQLHNDPAFEHVIISADSDFKQLVRPGVDLFIPMGNILYTSDGIFYQDGKNIKRDDLTVERYGETWKVRLNKKTAQPELFDPQWELFVKCIRGDSSDNIKSAWPRVTKKKMADAFYGDALAWNNFINSTWGEGEEQKSVKERYEFNKSLIDLTAQPEGVKDLIDGTIEEALNRPQKRLIGSYFAKFCGTHSLINVLKQANSIVSMISAPYES